MALIDIRWLRVNFILLSLIIFGPTFNPAIASKVDEEFDRITKICIQSADGVPGEAEWCYLNFENEIGRELQEVYDNLISVLGSKNRQLREAQRAWIKYQEKNCAFVEQVHKQESLGWARVSRSQCLLRNTLERKSDLEDYLEIVREERSEKQKYADCLEQNTDQSLKWLRDYCAVKFPLGAPNNRGN